MSSTNEFNDKSMNFRRLRRFVLEWLFPSEGNPEFPWETGDGDPVDPELGPLAFGPGLFWADGVKKTAAFNWQPYAAGTGIPDGADGEPAIFRVARHKFYGVTTAGAAVGFNHEFNTWPLVQCIERGGGGSGAPWLLYDPVAAGGSVLFDINLDTVTVDFGGAFEGIVVIVG